MGAWNDFTDAEQQRSGDLIPKGTIARVRLKIRPGGYNDPAEGWTGGAATRSDATGSVYLNCEYTVVGGPFNKRKVSSKTGLTSPKGPAWGSQGRAFVRAALEKREGCEARRRKPGCHAGTADQRPDGSRWPRVRGQDRRRARSERIRRQEHHPDRRSGHTPRLCRGHERHGLRSKRKPVGGAQVGLGLAAGLGEVILLPQGEPRQRLPTDADEADQRALDRAVAVMIDTVLSDWSHDRPLRSLNRADLRRLANAAICGRVLERAELAKCDSTIRSELLSDAGCVASTSAPGPGSERSPTSTRPAGATRRRKGPTP